MMKYHAVGWVEPAIPIDVQVCHLLGIAALNPTYEQQVAADCIRATGALSVGCTVRTMVIARGAHGLGGPAIPYGGIA
jgi:hypothetical protein